VTEPLSAGTVLGGRYRLERVLAEGGMGVLWIAQRVEEGDEGGKVAVKLLKGEGTDATMRRRLLREARAAGAIGHPNVVRVHEVLELADGAPALVMDLLDGESLRAHLEREGTLPLGEAVRLLLQVAAAVESAHALGIVHRDLKPENVFLARGPDGSVTVKVLDFGIAKFTAFEGGAPQTGALTNTGALLGTPYYMAPEQILGEADIDGRTDVWALGVILYECLAGQRAAADENVGKVLRRILTDAIPPLSSIAPGLPPDLLALVDRMTCFERRGRPADMAEVRAALEPFASSKLPALPSPSGASPVATTIGDISRTTAPERRRTRDDAATLAAPRARRLAPVRRPARKWLLGGGAFAAAAAGATYGWFFHAAHGGHAVPAPTVEPSTSPRCPAGTALVPGGDFMMGAEDGADDERPVHRVSVRDLCFDRTEVTARAYLACVNRGACRPPAISVDRGDTTEKDRQLQSALCHAYSPIKESHPINCVSFTSASAYCRAEGKRLPTEEEWEHAARGAEQRPYAWGSAPPGPLLLNACGTECAEWFVARDHPLAPLYPASDGFPHTAPVGSFPAGDTKDGLHDLQGNVWEWTDSPYCLYPKHDCQSPYHVFRGGSFVTTVPSLLRATARIYSYPELRYMEVGFRCVQEPAPQP
jgi:serine/threonine-protein kinase